MSVTRSPRLDEIRRRENIADAKRTSAWISGMLALAAFLFVSYIVLRPGI